MTDYTPEAIRAAVETLKRTPRTQWVGRCEAELELVVSLAERVAGAPVGKAYTPGELHFNKDEIQLTGVVPMFDVRSTKARGRTFALVNLEQKP
jgi:hypothetical protein